MGKLELNGSNREEQGKGLRKVRDAGFIPCVVYGHNREAQSIKVNMVEFERLINKEGKGANFDLIIDGVANRVIIKDMQKDHIKNRYLHVDFLELTAGEKVKVLVSLNFLNKEKIEDSQSIVQEIVHELEISVLPKDLLESFDIDVSGMKLGDSIKLKDLEAYNDERYSFSAHEDDILVVFNPAKSTSEESEEEGVEAEATEEEISVL